MVWPFSHRTAPSPPIDPARFRQAAAGLPWLRGLEAARLERLRTLAAQFFAEKTITPVHELRLTDIQRLRLALLCCLPLLDYGSEGLRGWSELIVYPGAFRVHHQRLDDHGVLHEDVEDLVGEAWEHGPVILSWADVRANIADPFAGHCVAVHEIAHKLDALDGGLDGTPPLPQAWRKQWAVDFQQAYDALCAEVDADRDTVIDPYAGESPEEFFAVCSEYHFSAPWLLQAAFPQVARHLEKFYGPSPAACARGLPLTSG